MSNHADFFKAIEKIDKVISILYKQKHIYKNDIEEEVETLYFSLERLKDKIRSDEDEDELDELDGEEDEEDPELDDAIIDEVDGVVLNILDSPDSLSWLTKNISEMKDSQRMVSPDEMMREGEEGKEEEDE